MKAMSIKTFCDKHRLDKQALLDLKLFTVFPSVFHTTRLSKLFEAQAINCYHIITCYAEKEPGKLIVFFNV